jgi:sRNA-binding regulator protein Hfq
MYDHQREREAQRREGSRMGADERPTLRLSEGRGRPKQYGGRDNNRKPSQTHTPKGHDAKLKAWQKEQRGVVVGLVFGVSETVDTHTGIIVDSDRYTITLRFTTGAEALIYKHAIACIYPQPDCCPEGAQ